MKDDISGSIEKLQEQLRRQLQPTSLPTTRFMSCPCSFDCEDKISATLQPDPDRLGSWETIALAIEKSTEAGHHTNHLVE